MTARCTCGGIAPGYPMHEADCAINIGDVQARDEAAEAAREQARTAAARDLFGVDNPWERVA